MLRRAVLRYASKAAAPARLARLHEARAFSSALPDGWEAIKRRNGACSSAEPGEKVSRSDWRNACSVAASAGDVVYYNKDLRKTVRHLPGVSPQAVAAVKPSEPETKKEESEESKAATVPHHESTGNEVFVPINFDTAMSIEGHDSQVVHFAKKFGVGFFGGEGFILQRLTGSGDVLVRASGTLIERELQPGEVLRISSGCLVAFEPSVHYDITMMKGAKNVLFGGEGLFVTTLTGPGKILLQSLPFDRVVGEMAARVPRGGPGGMMFPFMMGGGGGDQGANAGAADEAPGAPTDVDSGEDFGGENTEDNWNAQDDDIYGDKDDSASSSEFDDVGAGGSEESSGGGVMGFFDSLFGDSDD
ncbi:unnamed protein product [Phytophthora lilii]|uniref:Unnamed protein product n=1 Tax=Phytophthora lilii TaxID=2077276 RepID=A0A9W6TMW1_9STRA|nr:unnamed protein product [Phytophthora lilii]